MTPFTRFVEYLARWRLKADGPPLSTDSSLLLPVVCMDGRPAMLKIALVDEEQRGNALMVWWNGQGAVQVLEHDGAAILLERAATTASLADMARAGQDDEASRIICAVANRLHSQPASHPPADLVPLGRWFARLESYADAREGLWRMAWSTAQALMAESVEQVVLHGDLHHGNILKVKERGWLAIDPKGLLGERTFDFANLFCNPDADLALKPGRFARQLQVVSEAGNVERSRLVRWVLAWAGLSAAWMIDEAKNADLELGVARLAAEEVFGGPISVGTASYRTISSLDELLEHLRLRATKKQPLVIAVDGRSGTGKSTITSAIAGELGAVVIVGDDFYSGGSDSYWASQSPEVKVANCIDWRRIRSEVLEPLMKGQNAVYHPFDFQAGSGLFSRAVELSPAPVIVVDGAYSARPELSDLVDVKVLVVADDSERRKRLLTREGTEFMRRWHSIWDDAEDYYFSQISPASGFDLVLQRVAE